MQRCGAARVTWRRVAVGPHAPVAPPGSWGGGKEGTGASTASVGSAGAQVVRDERSRERAGKGAEKAVEVRDAERTRKCGGARSLFGTARTLQRGR